MDHNSKIGIKPHWPPHVVVASVIEQDGRFLMVYENDGGNRVYNQPAGHWDQGESIFDAARRETLEESGWEIKLRHIIGVYTHLNPENGITYMRTAFAATPIKQLTTELDSEIIEAVWLSYDEMMERKAEMRSPLVLRCIDDYLKGKHYPMDLVSTVE